MFLEIAAQFWYVWAFFAGFFVVRKLRNKEIKIENKILVIGHRGACGYTNENSKESFKKAIELGADFVECDVRRSLDGVFFLSHYDKIITLDRKKISISKTYSKELSNLRLKNGKKLARIEDYLEIVPPEKVFLDIKIKGAEFDFLKMLYKYKLVEKCLVSSHYADSLRLLKVWEPKLRTGLSFPKDRFSNPVKFILSPLLTPIIILIKHTYPFYLGFLASYAKADFIAVHSRFMLTKRLVKAAHKKNLLVFPFKVNERRNIKKMIRIGVDGIITDYPDRAREVIEKYLN